jgi:hypothetical protein
MLARSNLGTQRTHNLSVHARTVQEAESEAIHIGADRGVTISSLRGLLTIQVLAEKRCEVSAPPRQNIFDPVLSRPVTEISSPKI